MFGSSILSNLFERVIETGLVNRVFHSVILEELTKGGFRPAAPVKGRFVYVGPDDTKGFGVYCRQTGQVGVDRNELIGGCDLRRYHTTIPHRLVFFRDREKRSHDDLLSRLIKAVISTPGVRLSSVTNLHKDILPQEAPTGKFKFNNMTFYVSIDFNVLLKLQTDNCEDEIGCEGLNNPFCIGRMPDFNLDFNPDLDS